MKILAIEFSSAQRSVAVLQDSAGGKPSIAEVVETGSLSTQAFGMIEGALRAAELEREQIECVAVGLGPGSYTGIRAALALAQGWQLARPIKALGISSADVIAAQAQADGTRGNVSVVIDAQRGEFYLARYELGDVGWRGIQPLRLVARAEIEQRQSGGDLVMGPEAGKWFPHGRAVFPRAAMLAQLAAKRSDFVRADALEPLYLRETKFVKAPPRRVLPD